MLASVSPPQPYINLYKTSKLDSKLASFMQARTIGR